MLTIIRVSKTLLEDWFHTIEAFLESNLQGLFKISYNRAIYLAIILDI